MYAFGFWSGFIAGDAGGVGSGAQAGVFSYIEDVSAVTVTPPYEFRVYVDGAAVTAWYAEGDGEGVDTEGYSPRLDRRRRVLAPLHCGG